MEWANCQADWTRDCLRRIAVTAGFSLSDADREAVLQRVQHAASNGLSEAPACEPIQRQHLPGSQHSSPPVALVSLGPVENVDRLAREQQLRFALNGITLIFGENGSGKSGYARIAKRLCRSLSVDDLRGNPPEKNASHA